MRSSGMGANKFIIGPAKVYAEVMPKDLQPLQVK
jgi:hypothetical protein